MPLGRLPDTGRAYVLDTNAIDDPSPAMQRLREYAARGALQLSRTDTVGTELLDAPPTKKSRLDAAAEALPESLGPLVWGHSRWGFAVWATEDAEELDLEAAANLNPEHMGPLVAGHSRAGSFVAGDLGDGQRLDQVWSILHPGLDRATAKRNHIRDAMHLSTAIRYGADGFITNDRAVLNKAPAIASRFDGFGILRPDDALAVVERLLARARYRAANPPDA